MSKYGFDAETLTREVRLRNGRVRHVDLLEFSEAQLRQRQQLLIDPQASRGRGRGANTSIRLDRQRKYDFANGIQSWDLKLSDFKKSVEEDSADDIVLPIEEDVFKELPGYVTTQIANHLDEINAEPEEDLPVVNDDDDDEAEHEGAENPT